MSASRSEGPTLLKWYIALALTTLRNERGATQQDVADRLRRGRMTVTQWERAVSLPSAADIEVLFQFFEATDRTPQFLELLTAAKREKDWFTAFEAVIPEWFNLFLGLENGATQIQTFDHHVVPGLFQTRTYTEAVMRADQPHLDEVTIARRTELRQSRQAVLFRKSDPPMVHTILDEAVLKGKFEIMGEQLRHIAFLAEQPNITIQIVPEVKKPHAGMNGFFALLSFDNLQDTPTVAYVEGNINGTYYEKKTEVDRYKSTFTRLQSDALDPGQSLERVNRCLEGLL